MSSEPNLNRNPRSFLPDYGSPLGIPGAFLWVGFPEIRWGFRFVSRRVRGSKEEEEEDGRERREGADRREDGGRHGQGEEAARHPVLARRTPGLPLFPAAPLFLVQVVALPRPTCSWRWIGPGVQFVIRSSSWGSWCRWRCGGLA